MYEYVVACMLLMTPPPEEAQNLGTIDTPSLRCAISSLAIEWEIMDEREKLFLFKNSNDFEGNLNYIRRRYQELKDAPLVCDSQRWPDRATMNEFLSLNRAYKYQMDRMRDFSPTWKKAWYTQAIKEADELYGIYDLVRDAKCEYYYIPVRRQALLNLKNAIGDDNYWEGCLPPYVPLWRFQTVR